LSVEEIVFMPVGMDGSAWAYEVRMVGGGSRFLKVRTGTFTRPALPLPSYLFDHGLPQVVAPIGGVRTVQGLRLALYPFIDGPGLWSQGLTDAQWTAYGRFLGMLHAMELPGDVAGLLRRRCTRAQHRTGFGRWPALRPPIRCWDRCGGGIGRSCRPERRS
jgi:spectinomycin phosphotransferase